MQHFLARGVCLILLPIAIYIGSFYIHFYLLPKSGSGDSMMSSLFQHSLIGNDIQDSPLGKFTTEKKKERIEQEADRMTMIRYHLWIGSDTSSYGHEWRIFTFSQVSVS